MGTDRHARQDVVVRVPGNHAARTNSRGEARGDAQRGGGRHPWIKTCGQPYCTGYPDDEQKHRDAERAEIVAWLRRRDELSLSNVFGWIADEIEEKEHLK